MQIKKLELIQENLGKNKPIIDISIPNVAGVYFIYNLKLELIYVGQSKAIRKRLVQHISPNNKNRSEYDSFWNTSTSNIPFCEVNYYSYIEIQDNLTRSTIEQIMLNTFRPKYNLMPMEQKRALEKINFD